MDKEEALLFARVQSTSGGIAMAQLALNANKGGLVRSISSMEEPEPNLKYQQADKSESGISTLAPDRDQKLRELQKELESIKGK
jgi:hypothetical protein